MQLLICYLTHGKKITSRMRNIIGDFTLNNFDNWMNRQLN